MTKNSRSALINFPVNYPWISLILSILFILIVGSGASKLTFSDDIRVFFDENNAQLKAYESHEATYSKGNSLLFVIEPKDGTIFTRETLATIEELTEKAWMLPHVRRVDSITNFQHSYAEEDDLVVENLVTDAASLSDADVQRIKQVAIAEPMLAGKLVSKTGHVTGVNVPVSLPGNDPLVEQPELVAAARALAAEIEKSNQNIKVHLTGLVMINNALAEVGKKDMETLVPVMLLVILVILGFLLRSISSVFVTLLAIILSIIAGVGGAGWLGIQLSPPVATAANIIMALAVADSVHVLVSFLHGLREGHTKSDAMKESLKINLVPVFLTSFTTMLGFLSMNFSESPPFRDLGNVVAGGVVAAFVLTIFLVPALMMILPVRAKLAKEDDNRHMQNLASFVINNRKKIIVVMTVISVGLALFVPQNQLNDEFLKYFDENLEFRQATEFSIDNLTGFEFIEYSLQSDETGGINDPQYLSNVEKFAEWYRQQPEVKHVSSYTDIIKRLNRNMNADDPAWYRLPDNRELAAQFLLLYEMSLPFGLDVTDQINLDKSATRFRVSLDRITTNDMLALETRAEQWLEKNAPQFVDSKATGQSLMFAHIGARNIESMLMSTSIALIFISLLMIFVLRSLKFGLLSFIPNLVPPIIAFGIWGMLVGEVGLGLSVVVAMTMGIVVDDTVHFMTKYLHARRVHNYDPEQSVRYAFTHVGSALWVTSVVLVAGFAVLIFSNFQTNSGMGLLSAVTIAVALITDFFLLPALLLQAESNKHGNT